MHLQDGSIWYLMKNNVVPQAEDEIQLAEVVSTDKLFRGRGGEVSLCN